MSGEAKLGSFIVVTLAFWGILISGCKQQTSKEIPILKTLAVTNGAANSLKSGGEIISDGGSPIKTRGVCWSSVQMPTTAYADSLTEDGSGTGTFNSLINNLKPGKTYNIRAYATNEAGIGYGNQLSAAIDPVKPTLTTLPITIVSESSVASGGDISSDGGAIVISKGCCWNSKPNPTILNNITSDGFGSSSFTSTISNLNPDSTYYLRAYAKNLIGVSYGNSRSFKLGTQIVRDKDRNIYHPVNIGGQVWLSENLRSTRFNDSTAITLAEGSSQWSNLVGPGYCWYNNDPEGHKDTYGALYNWQAVSSGKLCPTGWHVPSDAEWKTLVDHLGGEPLAGGKLKERGTENWIEPNAAATNDSGFTALPGGYRTSVGEYVNIGNYGNWWSSTPINANVANYRYLYYGNGSITKSFLSLKYGLSVRCLKN